MSAISVVYNDRFAVIAGDGITYGSDGIVIKTVPKVYLLPHLQCVIAGTGLDGVALGIVTRIDLLADYTLSDFDDVMDNLEELVSRSFEGMCYEADAWGNLSDRDYVATVVIVGWSNRRSRMESYKIHSYDKPSIDPETGEEDTLEAWKIYETPQIWVNAWPGDDVAERFGIDVAAPSVDGLDMAAKLVCANRVNSGVDLEPDEHGSRCFAVGGFLHMTCMDQHQMQSWIAHRWPDVIGEIVDPARGEPMPKFPLRIGGGQVETGAER